MSKTTTTDMRLVPIDRLVPYVNNARTHSADQIMKLRSSLREFGCINPVIIDRDCGVIAGHGRLMAAEEEGFTEVPCVLVDHLTEAQKKAYILADNPEIPRGEALRLSERLMVGNKMGAFVLDLSFIGWHILSALTCGILGVLYVNPYIEATKAELYHALIARPDCEL